MHCAVWVACHAYQKRTLIVSGWQVRFIFARHTEAKRFMVDVVRVAA